MANGVLIVGPSGSGKSTSGEKLDPKKTFWINVKGKSLPFPGWKRKYTPLTKDNPEGNYFKTDDFHVVNQLLKKISEEREEIKYVVIDDWQYLAATEFMNRIEEKGFDKWNEIAEKMYRSMDIFNTLRDDLDIFYLTHEEEQTDVVGNKTKKAKTAGKLIDSLVTLEGLFTVVLWASVKKTEEGMKYIFETQNDGTTTAKSPRGMFKDKEIPNDLQWVADRMYAYEHGEEEKEVAKK